MLFVYKGVDNTKSDKSGTIEAINMDVAIASLQRRGIIITDIFEADKGGSALTKNISLFERVSNKDIVIISRQLATLFDAQVSALRIFKLLGSETENPKLARKLADISESLQGGSSISNAMQRHSDVFSPFYISMVKTGEETGSLDKTFIYLADYLDRTYEVTQKAKNALVYPAFIVFTFATVMVLMLTLIIPKIAGILTESGQEIPVYTKAVIAVSDLFVNYGVFLLIAVVVGVFFMIRFLQTETGKKSFDSFKLDVPYLGDLYQKLYLSRIADNMNTMLTAGIPMIKALELTEATVDSHSYQEALSQSIEDVKGGAAVSDAFAKFDIFPNILIQMIKVGEETGNLGEILQTLAKFYQREVTNAVDTLVGMIEPVMIIALAIGVGTLLASVLVPIYNVSSSF